LVTAAKDANASAARNSIHCYLLLFLLQMQLLFFLKTPK